jgi:hypothetical protein
LPDFNYVENSNCFPEGLMSNLEDADYFASRAIEERARSLTADDERVSAAHADMADRYEQLAIHFRQVRRRLQIVSENDAVRP